MDLLGLDDQSVWSTERAFQHLRKLGLADSKRTAERKLHELKILPENLEVEKILDHEKRKPILNVLNQEIEEARKKRKLILFLQFQKLPNGKNCLHAEDARGARFWVPFEERALKAIVELQKFHAKELFIVPHGELTSALDELSALPGIEVPRHSFTRKLEIQKYNKSFNYPHLKRLEDESIYIIREAVAESERPAMLYSVGKDSSVMLHLARKAFYPGKVPFPLIHVDTRFKFQQMYAFRDFVARESKAELIVHTNPEAIEKNINPFDHGSSIHTDITKTEGLKQVLNKYQFDVVFGGARRDEEKSRAKERIFSFRNSQHIWDPKNQRPELWNLFNTRKNIGESIRVFPLSNWTELDIWQYIAQENIPIPPLYFAKERPVIERQGLIMLVDDNRLKLLEGETVQFKKVRFRTLGCYPLTGAIESEAETIEQIIDELLSSRQSERQGRAIDHDSSGSMEKKKQEGYF